MKPLFLSMNPIELETQTSLLLARLFQIFAGEIPSWLRNSSQLSEDFSAFQNFHLYGEAFRLSAKISEPFCTVELSQRARDIQGLAFHLAEHLPIIAPRDGFVSRSKIF